MGLLQRINPSRRRTQKALLSAVGPERHMTMAAQRVRQIERPRDRGDAADGPVPTLHKASPVPLYYQLKSAIEHLLDSGQWRPDSQVPSERRLCEQFHISRITVRQALAELVREGRLIRSHGRGTFVAQAQLRKPVFPLVSFTQDVREHGMQPGAKVLLFEAT